MFTDNDLEQITQRELSPEAVEKQISYFKSGFPPLEITQAASVGNGILRMTPEQVEHYAALYSKESPQKNIVKFVPASGAATRMFKDLFVFVEKFPHSELPQADFIEANGLKSVAALMKNIRSVPFFDELACVYSSAGDDIEKHIEQEDWLDIARKILYPEGLGYGSLPKGLISFHKYPEKARKAAEEQLVEGAMYAAGASRVVKIHYTVSPEHEILFEALVHSARPEIEKEFHVTLEAEFSRQSKSTDTIAVDMDNEPFRDSQGKLVFRPGGHGALIKNLDAIDADVIFIKNIDNVVPDNLKEPTVTYKKVLAGKLLEVQADIQKYLRAFDFETSEENLNHVEEFVEDTLCLHLPDSYHNMDGHDKKEYLIRVLDRPIRVCGMVKNEGEPGGGPFWVRDEDGAVSLQIVESAQIDLSDPEKRAVFENSSHFNPVDLVCAVKSYTGDKFDLTQFVDHNTGFISKKSMEGRDLKALELPGLWNGAMSRWTTIFVEVPAETFNPVKTVNDLLRPAHQG